MRRVYIAVKQSNPMILNIQAVTAASAYKNLDVDSATTVIINYNTKSTFAQHRYLIDFDPKVLAI